MSEYQSVDNGPNFGPTEARIAAYYAPTHERNALLWLVAEIREYLPVRSAYKAQRRFRLWPYRLTLKSNPPIYHWLWWVWRLPTREELGEGY